MRRRLIAKYEACRVKHGPYASDSSLGCTGAFVIPYKGVSLRVIASDGDGWDMPGKPWEHVSVSLADRCPTWEEMSFVKTVFWDDDETVLQLHVPTDRHINNHSFCLHLWKPVSVKIPLPPMEAVGIKT